MKSPHNDLKIRILPMSDLDQQISDQVYLRAFHRPLMAHVKLYSLSFNIPQLRCDIYTLMMKRLVREVQQQAHLSEGLLMLARRILISPPTARLKSNRMEETLILSEEYCLKSDFPTIGGAGKVKLNFQFEK